MIEWSTLKKLIWLKKQGGAATVWNTVTGVSPLALTNAIAKKIKRLIQYGKCSTVDGEIYCNNGKLTAVDDELPVGYKRITEIRFDGDFYYNTNESLTGDDDVTMTLANTSTTGQNIFGSYNGTSAGAKNFSLFIYGGGSQSNCYFRYGEQLLRPRFGTGERTITFGKSGTDGFATDVSGTPETFTTPANAYIGMLPNSTSPAFTGSIIGNILVGTRLTYIPCERVSDGVVGYYELNSGVFLEPVGTGTPTKGNYDTSHLNVLSVEGTPEVLTIGSQTATVEDLFEVNGVADEQDIISGVITRKVEVSVSGGVITLSALATPVTEQTTPQPLSTTEGTNTVTWTAAVSGTVKEVEYAYVAPSFEWKTASGAVVSVSDAIEGEVGALTVGINPVQNFNGYDKPWPPGGGKNIFGGVHNTKWMFPAPITVHAGDSWAISTSVPASGNPRFNAYTGETAGTRYYNAGINDTVNNRKQRIVTWNADVTITGVLFDSAECTDIQIEISSTVSSFAPYSNVCPISGWTQIDVWVQPTYDTSANPSATIPLGGTVYGGTLDVLTGVLSVTKAYIASYAGESINEPWISSMDKYVSGTTPTTGAQVVYTLATPQTVQLTPAQVSTLLGTNVIWASGNGEISVTYRAEVSE